MPACIAGLRSETFTMTSLPVIIESSTISPSQPEPCGPFLFFEEFFFVELSSVFSCPFDNTVTVSDKFFFFLFFLSSDSVVMRFWGISSSRGEKLESVVSDPFLAESTSLPEWSGI